MDDMRASTPDERRALKAAVRRSCKIAGGAASVQHSTRAGEVDLSRYASTEHPDRHCPIDVAIELDREAGSPVIVSAMAALLGYRLVAEGAKGAEPLSMRDVAQVSTEAAQLISAVAEASVDGIDASEVSNIDKEAEETVAAIRRLQAKARGAVSK
jgi:hypothetical protein